MEENKISEIMDVTMTKIKQLVDSNTIVGEAITTPDGIVAVPISRVSIGFASGGAMERISLFFRYSSISFLQIVSFSSHAG